VHWRSVSFPSGCALADAVVAYQVYVIIQCVVIVFAIRLAAVFTVVVTHLDLTILSVLLFVFNQCCSRVLVLVSRLLETAYRHHM